MCCAPLCCVCVLKLAACTSDAASGMFKEGATAAITRTDCSHSGVPGVI